MGYDTFQIFPHDTNVVSVASDNSIEPIKCLRGDGLTKAVTNMLINIINEIGDSYRWLTEEQGREICGQRPYAVFARCKSNLTILTSFGVKKTTKYLENEHFNGEMDVDSGVAGKFSEYGCELEYSSDDNNVLSGVVMGFLAAILITSICCLFWKRGFAHASENSSDPQSTDYRTFST